MIEKDLNSPKLSYKTDKKMATNIKKQANVYLANVYLDTSVPSAYYDDEKPERQELTKEFWLKINDAKVYILELVNQELNQIEDKILKEKILKLLDNFEVLQLTDEVKKLADEYIKEDVVPKKFKNDAIHIAVAAVNNVNFLISWNFKHLVNVKTKQMVNLVNVKNGYKEMEIIAPPEF